MCSTGSTLSTNSSDHVFPSIYLGPLEIFHTLYAMPKIILIACKSMFPFSYKFVYSHIPVMGVDVHRNVLTVQIIICFMCTNFLLSLGNMIICLCHMGKIDYFMGSLPNCNNACVLCIFSPSMPCISYGIKMDFNSQLRIFI